MVINSSTHPYPYFFNHKRCFEKRHFDICLSQISFLHIYITYTKSFYKSYSSFLVFTVLNKSLSILL